MFHGQVRLPVHFGHGAEDVLAHVYGFEFWSRNRSAAVVGTRSHDSDLRRKLVGGLSKRLVLNVQLLVNVIASRHRAPNRHAPPLSVGLFIVLSTPHQRRGRRIERRQRGEDAPIAISFSLRHSEKSVGDSEVVKEAVLDAAHAVDSQDTRAVMAGRRGELRNSKFGATFIADHRASPQTVS